MGQGLGVRAAFHSALRNLTAPLAHRMGEGSRVRGFRRRYLEQELLEVSAVGIPANPNALALGLKAGAVEKSDLKDLSALLSQTLGAPPPLHSTPDTRHLLRLARELRELLKRI